MNRFFSIFFSLGGFLVFSILAACDIGGGGGGGGNGEKSSSSRFVPTQSVAEGDGSIDITTFEIYPSDRWLDIEVSVKANHEDSTLYKVEITLDGKVINPNPSLTRTYVYNTLANDDPYIFNGTEYCGGKVYVCLMARLKGESTVMRPECKSFTRSELMCQVPSSSSEEPSSSSASIPVVIKTLVPITFEGNNVVTINTVTGYKGIKLRDGEATSTLSEADFYLHADEKFVAKSGVNIVEKFDREKCETPRNGFGTIKSDCVPTPTTTERFVFKPDEPVESTDLDRDYYFLVRLSDTPAWNNDCYLVYVVSAINTQGNNKKVEIKVWKVE
ncbi:MAG: hypothetical protein LBQ87_05145 [Candidatus Fibromonas sp.]|jgi:hypothetical protein|nr:hypothetical protein [Candidatus Fibromonas sp.]